MEIGDCFCDEIFIYIIKEDHINYKLVRIYDMEVCRLVGYSLEQNNTLKNMRKLSQLEKELL
jgi:hypothetical protein